MDGEGREKVIYFPTRYSHYNPVDLAVDPDHNRLYWVDSDREELGYTGTSPITGTIHTVPISQSRFAPCAIAVKDDYIYWGDHTRGSVYRINKTNTGTFQRVCRISDPFSIHVYHSDSDIQGKTTGCIDWID